MSESYTDEMRKKIDGSFIKWLKETDHFKEAIKWAMSIDHCTTSEVLTSEAIPEYVFDRLSVLEKWYQEEVENPESSDVAFFELMNYYEENKKELDKYYFLYI